MVEIIVILAIVLVVAIAIVLILAATKPDRFSVQRAPRSRRRRKRSSR